MMIFFKKLKRTTYFEIVILALLLIILFLFRRHQEPVTSDVINEDYIKWIDFNVSYEALCKAYEIDVETYGQDIHLNWIELLAYTAAKNGGEFPSSATKDIDKLKDKLLAGETMKELTKDMKYYSYYLEAYSAVLDGFVGEYEIEVSEEDSETPNRKASFEKKYGLKAFSPIAQGFDYSGYDDFGTSRSYGYKREHFGYGG